MPSKRQTEPNWQYAYGHKVRLAQGTDSLRLLRAFAAGAMYYDPGIKLENASTVQAKSKKRSQFRVASRNITALYEMVETVAVWPERGCVADQPQHMEMQRRFAINPTRFESSCVLRLVLRTQSRSARVRVHLRLRPEADVESFIRKFGGRDVALRRPRPGQGRNNSASVATLHAARSAQRTDPTLLPLAFSVLVGRRRSRRHQVGAPQPR